MATWGARGPSWRQIILLSSVVSNCLFSGPLHGVLCAPESHSLVDSSTSEAASAVAEAAPRLTTDSVSPQGISLGGSAGAKKDAMTELLHWSLEHSDPERLKEVMQKYKDQNLTIKDVYGEDVLDALFVDEANVMKEAIARIADYSNTSLSDEELGDALNRLQEMVEQIDNAGNLHKMRGLSPLLELATSDQRGSDIQALALWTLGVATQNNEPVQNDLMSLQGLEKLYSRLPRCDSKGVEANVAPQYCGKLLFALSALVKNQPSIQTAADRFGVFDLLLTVIGHHSAAVAKKALGIFDTVLAQNSELPFLDTLASRQDAIGKVLIGLTSGVPIHDSSGGGETGDVDLAEMALRVISRFLSLRPMLFDGQFRQDLQRAGRTAMDLCERIYASGDEICEGVSGILRRADLTLTARDVSDDEL